MGLLDKAKARQTQQHSGGLLSKAADFSKHQAQPVEEEEKKNSSRPINHHQNQNRRP